MLLLQTYNLDYVLTFPTWISTVSATTIDNIILDRSKNDNMIVEPYYNGLSDHDAQLLTLRTSAYRITELATPRHVRSYEAAAVNAFKLSLSFENWEGVFNCLNDNDVNIMFNNFLNVYLRIFYISFPLHRTMSRDRCKGWITKGISISCRHKKDLYLLCKTTNNTLLHRYYKKHCKTVTSTIQLAKKLPYNK
jgi:hypothetical protein